MGFASLNGKKGYGTLMLKLALEKAKDLGITTALITFSYGRQDQAPSIYRLWQRAQSTLYRGTYTLLKMK